ncbi:hypothetical protein [Pseudomonas azotoformans]|uniref:Methyl-accepting chemotaxis protein n=1 Tax=Pseudomonas azotoformans TaxID=47878 RepID=A0A127HQR6_PSEAZ|nr:hypothetical protein [Pseudomonas azotoformans]AMN76865.1 methyl-accepting chemotaxis protein [Pseudomonas azotoformans]
MKSSRPTRTTAILSLCSAILAALLLYEHQQIVLLSERLTTSANNESINELLVKVREIDDRLGRIDDKKPVSDEDFRAGQQALSNRIDAAQRAAEQASEVAQDISSTPTAEWLSLKAEVESLSARVHDLIRVQTKQQSKLNDAANKVSSAPAKQQDPPFTVVGIEYRGGERFLSVGPLDSTRLSQLYLIQPGDTVAGTSWRLKALENNSARFDVAGTPQVVTVER